MIQTPVQYLHLTLWYIAEYDDIVWAYGYMIWDEKKFIPKELVENSNDWKKWNPLEIKAEALYEKIKDIVIWDKEEAISRIMSAL